ncbi:Threonyl/alanyl tRNA synthetase [Fusarium oxysporum]|nr:Threonyl/alanyl tRNA synthetase [Fusarium oxysporum]
MDRFGHTEAVYHRDETQHVMETTVLASIPYADWDNSINKVFKDASDGLFLSSIFTVTSVQKLPSGTIMHLGTYSGAPFKEQTLVTQEINKDTRKLHSQIHDAGHILASAVRRLGIPDLREVKAQHYPGTAFVDFQGIIPGDRKEEIEQLANQIVNDDRSINVHWWSREELEAKSWTMPEDSDGQGGLVRAVEIDGEGAYMCGGTHVRSTALVGKIRVRKVKRQQGISRVSYELV